MDGVKTWHIILSISVILILVFWILLIILAINNLGQTAASDGAQVLVSCPTDQCATNIYSGQKRCPASGGVITADAGFEVCVSRGSCDDPTLPYAVQSDESTNILGVCEDDPLTNQPVTCRCLSRPQCPSYVLSGWKTYTGNPYVGLVGQRTSFTQFSSSDPDLNGYIKTNTPLTYDDDGNKFCFASAAWLPISTPGCTFMTSVDADSITACMNTGGACDRGVLAFVGNADTFTAADIQITPMACVQGTNCRNGQVNIYDLGYGGVVCKTIT